VIKSNFVITVTLQHKRIFVRYPSMFPSQSNHQSVLLTQSLKVSTRLCVNPESLYYS
jgi:hypothetical protein